MRFELEENNRGISDEELLADLRRCASQIGRNTITLSQYAEIGKAHPSTFQRRFNSWVRALELAGLAPSRSKIGIPDEELLANIEQLWIQLGRQPRYTEVKVPASKYSAGTYERRFGSWRGALSVFISWVSSDEPTPPQESKDGNTVQPKGAAYLSPRLRRTNREISDRRRFRILVRDGFRCLSCGASPLVTPGVELHVDHIIPWSNGG